MAYAVKHNQIEAAWNQLTPREKMIAANVLSMRRGWLEHRGDPRRSVEDECGHPKLTEAIDPWRYHELYDRHPIAARVVQVLPKESWQVQPQVYEEESPDVQTPFEKAWAALNQDLSGPSWHKGVTGSPVMEALKRADELSGIGRYGVMLLGLDDVGQHTGKTLADAADWVNDPTPPQPPEPTIDLDPLGNPLIVPGTLPAPPPPTRKLLFIRCFPETLAQISTYDNDPASPRFGQPLSYSITFSDPQQMNAEGTTTATYDVHWTRVIHLADNLGSSEVFGVPRQQQVFDNLLDLKKLYGGSAEMYWRGAFPGLSLTSQQSMGGEVEYDAQSLRDEMENYSNGLQRYLALIGFDVKSLAPQVVDPTPQILAHIQAICIKLGVPMRVFMGSERGELASSQDDAAWNDRLRERQHNYLTPRVIVPFVDRLIRLGVLPKPQDHLEHDPSNPAAPPTVCPGRFLVWWPDLTSQTPKEKTAVAFQRTQAMAQYVKGEAYKVMAPIHYWTLIMGLTEEEAMAVCQTAGIDPSQPYVPPTTRATFPSVTIDPITGLLTAPTNPPQDPFTALNPGVGVDVVMA